MQVIDYLVHNKKVFFHNYRFKKKCHPRESGDPKILAKTLDSRFCRNDVTIVPDNYKSKHKKQFSLLVLFSALVFFPLKTLFAATVWQPLAPGIEYTDIIPSSNNPWGHLHAFRIDLNHYQLDLAFAKDQQDDSSSVQQLALKNHAILAVNGGFFTPEHQPIGLRIQDGKVRSHLKATHWWGIFYIKKNKPYITAQSAYATDPHITFAVQGGPRLVADGKIPPLKEGDAERTAIGFTHDHKIILLATDNAPMSTTELATIMLNNSKENGLDCYNALNLDGGHSTQLYAQLDHFILNIPGLSSITDAVLVLAKDKKK